jgi:hypothetical protein
MSVYSATATATYSEMSSGSASATASTQEEAIRIARLNALDAAKNAICDEKEEIPDLRGKWNYYVKVLRLESPIDTLTFPGSYKSATSLGCTMNQDWDGDRKFVSFTIPAAPPLRPIDAQLPGMITFVNGDLQLALSDVDDNGVNLLKVTKTDSNGKITELKGLYTESGFSSVNPDQKPTTGEVTLVRV